MASYSHLPYRLGVGVMLFNGRGQVFVARRIDMTSEAWQMPQGGIDAGEDPEEAAYRELEEETGLDSDQVELIGRSRGALAYDLPDDLVPLLWKGKYRGQEQWWFAMRLVGDESKINIETEHPEFSEWKWEEVGELPNIIVPFKRTLYEQLVSELGGLAAASRVA